jgi:hypothetical protein
MAAILTRLAPTGQDNSLASSIRLTVPKRGAQCHDQRAPGKQEMSNAQWSTTGRRHHAPTWSRRSIAVVDPIKSGRAVSGPRAQ